MRTYARVTRYANGIVTCHHIQLAAVNRTVAEVDGDEGRERRYLR